MSLSVENMGRYKANLLSMHHQMDLWAASDLIQYPSCRERDLDKPSLLGLGSSQDSEVCFGAFCVCLCASVIWDII